jgi:hypothetical protein
MRRMRLLVTVVTLSVLSSAVLDSTAVGLGVIPAGAAVQASKAVFCGANDSIDRGSANITSNAGFLAFLKTHTHDLAILRKNAPPGALGQTVQQTVKDAEAAISSNSPNALNNLPSGGAVDTYCGVDGEGNALPGYFNKGTRTQFCSTFLPIFAAVGNAPDATGRLAVLTVHKSQVSQLASELSTLPKSVKAKATSVVDKAETAITTNNPGVLESHNGSAADVALYCGQNQ